VIPTGIRAVGMNTDTVLLMAPRSGLGFRYRVGLANTIGVIDSDYAGSSNEGHIMVKITYDDFESITKINDITLMNPENPVLSVETTRVYSPNVDKLTLHFNAGDKFCQGIFTYCLFTDDDNASNKRNGGFGSTGNT
jgi:dUTP pyrophosphatase